MAPRDSSWYSFVRWFVRTAFFGPLGGIRTFGEAGVPTVGPTIIAPVHLSLLDPPAVACGTRRQLSFMAKEELFRGLFGRIIASVGSFPVRRGEGDTESVRTAIDRLNEGRALLLFPEGTRGDGETLGKINRGVAMLAKRTGAVVVPAAIVGTHVMWPRGQKRIRRHGVKLAFGRPFTYAGIEADSEKNKRRLFGEEIERQLVELCAVHGLQLKIGGEDLGSEPETSLPAAAEPQSAESAQTPRLR